MSEFLLFCNRTLDGYEQAITGLSDAELNAFPPLPDPNSPYQLVTHAIGAGTWWTARIICGRPVERDRDGEFSSAGSGAELAAAIADFRRLLDDLEPDLASATELAHEASTQTPLGQPWTVGAALIHAYEELAQHLGHLQITTDLVRQN